MLKFLFFIFGAKDTEGRTRKSKKNKSKRKEVHGSQEGLRMKNIPHLRSRSWSESELELSMYKSFHFSKDSDDEGNFNCFFLLIN